MPASPSCGNILLRSTTLGCCIKHVRRHIYFCLRAPHFKAYMSEILSSVASIATAIGVAVAAYQLYLASQQATTSCEDGLNTQYRQVIERLPLEALFGEDLTDADVKSLLPHFYRYFDLCNEQAFLHRLGRVSRKTWTNWEEGITANMSRPAFAKAWKEVAHRAKDDFSDLRTLCPPDAYDTQ